MPRSLFTAVAGLQTHQQRMDVLSDNISNANTIGFKASRMTFIESFNQSLRQPSDNQPVGITIGLGNQISCVAQQFTQGSFQRTGVDTDIALSGDGFMVVQDTSGAYYFTRDGSFSINADGYLITSLGYNVMGVSATWNNGASADVEAADPGTSAPGAVGKLRISNTFYANPTYNISTGTYDSTGNTVTITTTASHGYAVGDTVVIADCAPAAYNGTFTITAVTDTTFTYTPASAPATNMTTAGTATDTSIIRTNTTSSYSIGTDGKITLFGSQGDSLVAGYMTLANFANPQGLVRAGNSLYSFNSAAGSQSGGTEFSPTDDVRKAGTNGYGTTQSGALELSTVDLADQFTDMIVTQRGFDACAKVITTADEMLQTLNGLKR
ncbi:MAG: flagellar hook-basal body complex protein [Verrucomicrobiae bacterium]|nr:flagellar hook-basal body complex protein [Verrucomicrobiae bacterium]